MFVTPYMFWRLATVASVAGYIFFTEYRLLSSMVITVLVFVFAYGIKNIRSQFFGKVFYKSNNSLLIALTFDDGPDPNITPCILAILKAYSIKATFFVVGIKAQRHPGLVRQCFDEGHTIACHDLHHSFYSNFRLKRQLIRDITLSRLIVKNIIGKEPLFYRPPVGLMNPNVVQALRGLGMRCIGWNASAVEAGNRRIKQIKKIHTLSKPGAIVLLHDVLPKNEYKDGILREVESLCKEIKKSAIAAVTVDEMLGITAYQ
jgi:peptidoglycan/xylan/chitin deacetylase (PgdA/CDA1 family)